MESKWNFKIVWEGELLLDFIKWNKKTLQEYQPPPEYISEIKGNWDKHIKDNPNDYDGNLLFLDNYQFRKNYLFLDTSFMKFSTATYLVKNKIPIKKGIGVLGTQYLIFSPNKQYILVGERSLSQSYFPGALCGPGGMLELNDLNTSPKEALTREMYEEVCTPLKSEAHLVAMLVGWNGVSVAFIISTKISDSYKFNPNEIISAEKDEWECNLKWLSVEKLKKIQINQLLEGLIYYRSKIINS